MRLRESSAVSLILPLVLSVLLAALLAGCGGGSGQSESGGDQEQKQEGEAKKGGEAAKKEPLQRKIAIGTVKGFHEDRRRVSLRPTVKAQSDGPLAFKIRKHAKITLGGKKAELTDIKEGQQAQIEYVVENEVNRALVVHLFEAGGQNTGDAGNSG